jgi:guanyl-specific ribonuclease Sa
MMKQLVFHLSRWAQRCLLVLAFILPLGAPCFAQGESHSTQVALNEIPVAARKTLSYIRTHGEAPQGYVGGRRFGNYGRNGEQKLPVIDAQGKPITYQEWDIYPKVRGRNRGAERIVTGSDGRAWYTADHYRTYIQIKD